jgi:hypothetical protein
MMCETCRGPLELDGADRCRQCTAVEMSLAWAVKLCEARAHSLAESGNIVAANEAQKCAEAIRRAA